MGADEWTSPFDEPITDADVLAALRDGTMDGSGAPTPTLPPTHASVAIQTGDTAAVAREGGVVVRVTTGPVDAAAATLAALAALLPDPPTGPTRTRTTAATTTDVATDDATTTRGDVQLL